MKYKFTNGAITRNLNGTYALTIELGRDINAQSLNDLISSDKLKSVEIKYHRKKRSLDANAYLWVMLDKMAKKLGTTKEELYITEIKRYGVFKPMIFNKESLNIMQRQFKAIQQKATKQVDGVTMIKALCYFGSSTYNTDEFTRLLDGVINDAKELDIDVITQTERDRVVAEYEKS